MSIAEPEILLNDCREIMTSRLHASLSVMMGNLEHVLFEMASRDQCDTDSAYYIDAVRELRLKKREIQVRFENRLSGIYLEILRQLAVQSDSDESNELITSNSEASISINKISVLHEPVGNIRSECRQALVGLDRHVNYILDDIHVENFVNPLQPETIYNAFWESFDDLRCGKEIKLIMLQMFDRQISTDLISIYDDLNKLLDFFLQHSDSEMGINNDIDEFGNFWSFKEESLYCNSFLVGCWVHNTIIQRIKDRDLPEFIEAFLMDYWCVLLVDIFEKYSMKSIEWERAIQVVDDLIKFSALTDNKESRLQQIWQFPGLIYRLKAGMKSISLPLDLQAKFVSDLKVLHTQLTEQKSTYKNN